MPPAADYLILKRRAQEEDSDWVQAEAHGHGRPFF